MYGQIYKMQLNNYVYIGAHKGDIYKDDYFGSGIRWINILNKYGKENVQRFVFSEKLLGVPKTQQHKDKLSEHFKGRRWYNNGVEQKQLFECPQGWVHGRIKTK